MTSAQIGTWLAFDELEPIGRDWERSRLQTSYTAEGLKEPLRPEHFGPAPVHEDYPEP